MNQINQENNIEVECDNSFSSKVSLETELSENPPPPGYYIHEVGGAAMGLSEEESVVNKSNQLWRCKNVLILDGACWPTSSWQSPTLTMMAISRRACLNIKKT